MCLFPLVSYILANYEARSADEKRPLAASFIQFSVHEKDVLLARRGRRKLNLAAESIKALAEE